MLRSAIRLNAVLRFSKVDAALVDTNQDPWQGKFCTFGDRTTLILNLIVVHLFEFKTRASDITKVGILTREFPLKI